MTQEFYLDDDGIRLHLKLERPEGDAETPGGADDLAVAAAPQKTPLMLLIHGLTGHMEERHILAMRDTCLQHGFAVLRADLYGHGQSGGAFRNHTLFKWLTNIMTITDYARSLDWVSDLYLMGHSQGGYATMLAGGMRPDAYRAIIPLSPAISLENGAKSGHTVGVYFEPLAVPDELPRPVTRALSGNYIRALQMLDVDAAIRRYQKPVLIVHGDADQTVPVQCAIDAAAKYADCRLVLIPGDLHCFDYHLDQVQEAVGEFLEEIKGR